MFETEITSAAAVAIAVVVVGGVVFLEPRMVGEDTRWIFNCTTQMLIERLHESIKSEHEQILRVAIH